MGCCGVRIRGARIRRQVRPTGCLLQRMSGAEFVILDVLHFFYDIQGLGFAAHLTQMLVGGAWRGLVGWQGWFVGQQGWLGLLSGHAPLQVARATRSGTHHSKWHAPLDVARHSKWHTPLEVARHLKWHEVEKTKSTTFACPLHNFAKQKRVSSTNATVYIHLNHTQACDVSVE